MSEFEKIEKYCLEKGQQITFNTWGALIWIWDLIYHVIIKHMMSAWWVPGPGNVKKNNVSALREELEHTSVS